MLRIAMITPLPPQNYGESYYSLKLLRNLDKSGKLEIIAITGEGADSIGGNTKTLHIWRNQNKLYPFTLLRHLRNLKPHLVHVQFGPYGKLFGGFFGEVMLILLLLLRLCGIKTTVTLHSTWMPNQVKERVSQFRVLRKISILAKVMFRIFMKLLDLGTTSIQLSTVRKRSKLRDEFLRQYQINPKKTLEIPHAFDNSFLTMDSEEAKKELGLISREVVLAFGFIRRGKGLDVAIDAMSHLKEIHPYLLLLIAGHAKTEDDEIYLQEITERVKAKGLVKSVQFDSWFIPDDDVSKYFAAASVLVIPYTESVGASGPIHNYASLGVPIVASRVGLHMPETLDGNLILFQAGNSQDLAQKLVIILEDSEMQGRLSKTQREYAKRESWATAADRTLANYYRTLSL